MEKEGFTKRKSCPPPIPKRSPNTCLSTNCYAPATLLTSRSFDHDKPRKVNVYRRQHSTSTLPHRQQRLDVCTELLNYISELTQELMAETSFTEVSSFDEGVQVNTRHSWPYSRSQSSVAIQTEGADDLEDGQNVDPAFQRRHSDGRSIGVQVTKTKTPEDEAKFPAAHKEIVTSPDSNKAFREIRKMLKEGSIEGIEDDPPIFKPPPPPVTPLVQKINRNNVRNQKVHTAGNLGPQVRRCLSTFEPSAPSAIPPANNNKELSKRLPPGTLGQAAPRRKKITLPPKTNTSAAPITTTLSLMHEELPAGVSSCCSTGAGNNNNNKEMTEQRRRKHPKTSSIATKSATVDRCIRHRLSPATAEKQRHAMRTPPPPPVCKDPPPKIVVGMPSSKHRQNSSCGTTCSCLCLKRQSPCGSPVPSMGSTNSTSPTHASPAPKTKFTDVARFSPDAPVGQQETYNALIEEIRAAIKQRHIGCNKNDDNGTTAV